MQIEIAGLAKEYGNVVALQDVNFTIPSGAVLALTGPNGAGKSTLMKIIAGLIAPTEGTVKVGDLDVRMNPRAVHKSLGFLPDFFGLYDDLTVKEFLLYFARTYGYRAGDREERVQALIEKCGLIGKVDAEIGTLSRGLRQRVGIARTLVNDPKVILLDEPAAGLDPEARHDLQSLFRRLGSEGRTLVVSSHILTELEDYSTHVAMMQKGRLVSFGEIDSVRTASQSGRRLRMKFVSGADAAEQTLLSSNGVSALKRDGLVLNFLFNGDEPAQAELLALVIQQGAAVVSLEQESGGRIQDSYLALMKGTSE